MANITFSPEAATNASNQLNTICVGMGSIRLQLSDCMNQMLSSWSCDTASSVIGAIQANVQQMENIEKIENVTANAIMTATGNYETAEGGNTNINQQVLSMFNA